MEINHWARALFNSSIILLASSPYVSRKVRPVVLRSNEKKLVRISPSETRNRTTILLTRADNTASKVVLKTAANIAEIIAAIKESRLRSSLGLDDVADSKELDDRSAALSPFVRDTSESSSAVDENPKR